MKRRSENKMKTEPQQITSFITDFPHWLAVVFLASFAMSTTGMLFGAAGFFGGLLLLGSAGMLTAFVLNYVLSRSCKAQS